MPADTSRYTNDQTGYEVFISDWLDLLTDEEEENLLPYMIPITEYGNVVFESQSLVWQTAKQYISDQYSEYWDESASVFLIDMENRELNLFSSGKIKQIVTPSYANSITDNIYPYASDGDYFTCAAKAYEQEAVLLRGGKIAQPMKYISCGLMAIILALLINYFIMRIAARNAKASSSEMMKAAAVSMAVGAVARNVTRRVRHVSSQSHGGGGSHHFGGGHSGHSGGGFSGGSHKF